jgi:predicted metalloprotease
VETTKIIDDLKHNHFLPLYQSLKAHIDLSYSTSFHISSSVLKDIVRRVQAIEEEMLGLLNNKEVKE